MSGKWRRLLDRISGRPWLLSDGETPEEAVINGKDALRCMLLTKMEFGDPIPEPGSSVPLAVPAGIHDRLSAVAGKRHVRPEKLGSELIAEALAKSAIS
jgi:antitoxin HicB